jgi:hypothetical protein
VEGITTIHLVREICCSISIGTFYWRIEAFVRLLQIRFKTCEICALAGQGVTSWRFIFRGHA